MPGTRVGSLSISPIVPASGIETRLEVGRSYVFLFSSFPEQADRIAFVTRAEPAAKRKDVLDFRDKAASNPKPLTED